MPPRPAFAVSLHLSGRNVVVVGKASQVRERLQRLDAAGARVVHVEPDDFQPAVCEGAFLILAETLDAALDREIATRARGLGCLCYVHDQPEVSDLAMPALARRGPLSVAISTSATAPALARHLGREIQALLDRAGQALDRWMAYMQEERVRLPRALRKERMAELARCVVLQGDLHIRHIQHNRDDEPSSPGTDTGEQPEPRGSEPDHD